MSKKNKFRIGSELARLIVLNKDIGYTECYNERFGEREDSNDSKTKSDRIVMEIISQYSNMFPIRNLVCSYLFGLIVGFAGAVISILSIATK